MAQYAIPIVDIDKSFIEFAGDGDADAFNELNEGFGLNRGTGSGPNDANSWRSPTSPALDYLEHQLSALAVPKYRDDHIIRMRARKDSSGGESIDLIVTLGQFIGGFYAPIIAKAFPNVGASWVTFIYSLTREEAESITVYENMSLTIDADVSAVGDARFALVSALEFEIPDQLADNTAKSVPAAFTHSMGDLLGLDKGPSSEFMLANYAGIGGNVSAEFSAAIKRGGHGPGTSLEYSLGKLAGLSGRTSKEFTAKVLKGQI